MTSGFALGPGEGPAYGFHGSAVVIKASGEHTFGQLGVMEWGWTVVLNPDGTTTAWNKDRTKVLHSHSPPTRAG